MATEEHLVELYYTKCNICPYLKVSKQPVYPEACQADCQGTLAVVTAVDWNWYNPFQQLPDTAIQSIKTFTSFSQRPQGLLTFWPTWHTAKYLREHISFWKYQILVSWKSVCNFSSVKNVIIFFCRGGTSATIQGQNYFKGPENFAELKFIFPGSSSPSLHTKRKDSQEMVFSTFHYLYIYCLTFIPYAKDSNHL